MAKSWERLIQKQSRCFHLPIFCLETLDRDRFILLSPIPPLGIPNKGLFPFPSMGLLSLEFLHKVWPCPQFLLFLPSLCGSLPLSLNQNPACPQEHCPQGVLGSVVKFFKGEEGRKTQAHPSLSFLTLWFPITMSSLRGYQTPRRALTVTHPFKPLIAWRNFRLDSYVRNMAPQPFVGTGLLSHQGLLGKRRNPAQTAQGSQPQHNIGGGWGNPAGATVRLIFIKRK